MLGIMQARRLGVKRPVLMIWVMIPWLLHSLTLRERAIALFRKFSVNWVW
jgi:hypothetical protein